MSYSNARPLKVLQVIVYFAYAPDEEMTATDIEVRFGIPAKGCTQSLYSSIRDGVLAKTQRDRRMHYTAGPRLREWVKGKIL